MIKYSRFFNLKNFKKKNFILQFDKIKNNQFYDLENQYFTI